MPRNGSQMAMEAKGGMFGGLGRKSPSTTVYDDP